MRYNILVIDDDNSFIESVKSALKRFGVTSALSIDEAKARLNDDIDLVLLDLVFDENNPEYLQGLDFLPEIHRKYPDLQVIIMTNYPSKDKIVSSIKSGAADFFIKKELIWPEWEKRIENYCRNSYRIKELKKQLKEKYDETQIIGNSPQIDFVRRKLKDLAENSEDITIFIYGETGTGKNLAVKYFRKYSIKKDMPYKEFSLFELSETVLESELFGYVKGAFTGANDDKIGLFEAAHSGILFLDEIGDYDIKTQKKIMRFIEDRTITPVGSTKSKKLDLQLIMATNQYLPGLIRKGKFREDLYQRINRIKIEMPPLREIKQDIRVLTDYFFNHFRQKEKTNLKSVSKEVYSIFKNYKWPGNVRELQSVIWEACTNARLLNDTILISDHLRREIITYRNGDEDMNSLEKEKIQIELNAINNALKKTFGSKEEAANLLRLNADQLRYRVRKHIDVIRLDSLRYEYIKKYYKIFFADFSN